MRHVDQMREGHLMKGRNMKRAAQSAGCFLAAAAAAVFLLAACPVSVTAASDKAAVSAERSAALKEAKTPASSGGTAGEDVSGSKTPAKKKTGKWVRKKGYYYYYDENGKKLKNGIHEIGKKKYYFDRKGRQRTGWRKIKGHAYFFRYENGKGGYMVTGRKVDGIRLKKSGRAAPKGSRARKKLPVLLEIQKQVDGVVKPAMKSSKKLKKCFEYVKNHYGRWVIPELGHSAGDWDLEYVSYMLKYGHGDCYCFGATFAYYANALGFKNVLTVNDDGHGWTEIGGKVYDSHWAAVIGSDKCYAVPDSLSGRDGRPNWAKYRLYSRNCDK